MKVLLALTALVAIAAFPNVQPVELNSDVLKEVAAASALIPKNRITSGELAETGQFPYQVALILYRPDNTVDLCGGALISENWILTTARCTEGVLHLDVKLGNTNRDDPTEPHQQTLFIRKKNIFIHEDWDRKNLINDISLIKLPMPIDFNDHVKKVDLPKKEKISTYVGENAIASGWGRTSDKPSSTTPNLRFIKVPVIPNDTCQRSFYNIMDSHICIRHWFEPMSTCNGDFGGPLVKAGTNELIGLSSFVSNFGCRSGSPAVFTRVTSFLDWIEKTCGVH